MPPSPDYVVRPMTLADVPAAERLTAEGFLELDRRTSPRDAAPPQLRSDSGAAAWRARVEHIVAHDAPGCWVAERTGDGPAGELLGVAVSLRRELMWVLTTYVVRPGVQGMGVGRHLLDAALGYGEGCLRGMLAASDDPRAARRYRAAG
ncbi:MAG TPA: GNAT family N-acetyltransferase, partial [Nocardioidaceae bacterium]|nr:GNAT family N-acetyltransferase [Nocardioidaceae bacterium]